jgi:zinc-binding alcohol dehydrogenase/oxidoreductase
MAAWFLDTCPGKYQWGRVGRPAMGPDDVEVEVVASALNHMDLWVAQGLPRPPLPHVPGCDVAGVVHRLGANVSGWAAGDEVVINPALSPVDDVVRFGNDSPIGPGFAVFGEHVWGGHGEYAVVPARNLARRPPQISWEQSAAFPLTYLTAYRMMRRSRLRVGERTLIVGIGSGVSLAALSLALQAGAEVVVTSRSESKLRQALELGAAEAFNSADASWPTHVDVIFDSVGPATWDKAIRTLRPGGRLVTCGGTSGPTVKMNLPRLFFKQHEIIGSSMGSYREFDELVALIGAGLHVAIDTVEPLEHYDEALRRLEEADQFGKIVLRHR